MAVTRARNHASTGRASGGHHSTALPQDMNGRCHSRCLGIAIAFLAADANANTGLPPWFGWLVLSLFGLVPILLLVPVVVLALAKWPKEEKLVSVLTLVLVGGLSYGTLLWATYGFALGATEMWPVIFLWLLPSYICWFVLARKYRDS